MGAWAEIAYPSSVPVRIGWQIPAATQGQVLQVLKRTNVLESHGLKPVFIAYGQPDTLQLIQQRAKVLQTLMWSHVETLAELQGETSVNVLFTRALNEVFNLHTKRVVLGVYYRIPTAMWLALILASSVAMFAVGFQFGIGGNRRIHTANLALAVTFALVMVLAFDLDRAGEGLVAVNQQPMIDLYQSMLE